MEAQGTAELCGGLDTLLHGCEKPDLLLTLCSDEEEDVLGADSCRSPSTGSSSPIESNWQQTPSLSSPGNALCALWNAPDTVTIVGLSRHLTEMIPDAGNHARVADLLSSFDVFRAGIISLVHNCVDDAMKKFEKARVSAVHAMHQVNLAGHKLLATKIIISCIYLEVMYSAHTQTSPNSRIASFEVLKEVLKNLHDDKVISKLIKLEQKGGVRSWFSKKSRRCVLKSLNDMDVWVESNIVGSSMPPKKFFVLDDHEMRGVKCG
eukprot:TRINITY_DN19904_c0_g3_i1.p1 TRINITY_DN19904_c0_g3~~TRINITY_DN19904_c0_g3_i1.p1  ORF type:complete len:264 (-),score=51.50 TRINITY_DN19904_c0_g3_i1:100-891(-)